MEKRVYPRKDSSLFIRYQVPGTVVSWSSFTRDISRGGAKILSPQYFPPESNLDVTIDLPGMADYFYSEAEVRWVSTAGKENQSGNPLYCMGVMFTHNEALDTDQLRDYLEQPA